MKTIENHIQSQLLRSKCVSEFLCDFQRTVRDLNMKRGEFCLGCTTLRHLSPHTVCGPHRVSGGRRGDQVSLGVSESLHLNHIMVISDKGCMKVITMCYVRT